MPRHGVTYTRTEAHCFRSRQPGVCSLQFPARYNVFAEIVKNLKNNSYYPSEKFTTNNIKFDF